MSLFKGCDLFLTELCPSLRRLQLLGHLTVDRKNLFSDFDGLIIAELKPILLQGQVV